GGFEAMVGAFASRVKARVETGWEVQSVRFADEHWHVMSKSGEERLYDELVSTIPIHDLIPIWDGAPPKAKEAASRLRYNSLINVVIGCSEDRGYPYTALYVPDEDILFHRLSFPKAFSEKCVPAGHSSVMAEITTNEGDGVWELSDEEVTQRVIDDLVKIDFVDPSTIVYKRVVRFRYGYPVYDLEYRRNVTAMRAAVESAGLHLLGRFAQFDYINSDVCVERALALAPKLYG
ncbi:MAG TPA: FAD-dependent oxidoreductase, partial [Thermoanaerobaculia bacterium]|nr:FAD-dependent oxidoreductase [Thermoanaerobaculia bacterium]